MPEQEYQTQIQSLIVKKLEKPKYLFQESGRYWDHIDFGYYDFEQGKIYVYIICFFFILLNWIQILKIYFSRFVWKYLS